MPQQNSRQLNTDQNLINFVENIAQTYRKMGLLSQKQITQTVEMPSVDAVNKIISRVDQLDPESKKVFGNYFVGENLENLDMATRAPAILAAAYEYISEHRNDSDEMRERFARIGAHVDTLSANFANSGGMVVRSGAYPLVDTNNIADTYEGLLHTFAARRADVERAGDTTKVDEFNRNLDLLQTVIAEYDHNWGLSNLYPEHAAKLEDRWDDLWDALNTSELFPDTKLNLKKWKFLDSKEREIPQFTRSGRLDKRGRLAAIVNLARHDVAKRHAARVNEKINEDLLEAELNDEIGLKLYNLAVADKIVNDATADPDRFNNPEYRAQLMDELMRDGAAISDAGYNAQIDADVNATAGWAARIKSKIGSAAENLGGFFGKIFRPISRVDRLANVRMTGGASDKRAKRIEFFKRVLKGFASAFIASALITTIATAAAATAGISLAASMATIGMVTAIGMGVTQVARWRKAQRKAGQPTDIRAFLSDKRLVSSLGVSAIAVVAMCFGAAGMASAAASLGYGALALGGAKNTVETFRDARRSNMSLVESLAWAIANAGAVIAGGFTGRMAANAGINYYNERNPENTLLQNARDRTIEHTTEHTETRTEYTSDALDNAERIVKMWYRNNPDMLQQHIDAINAYNAEYGTNIDPYRAIMINADAGGQTFDNMRLHVNNSHIDANINDVYSRGNHRVLTDAWGRNYDFSPDELRAAANLFNPDGSINPDGMDVVSRLDNYIGENNTVGYVQNRPVHTDNYLNQNDIARGDEASTNGKVYSTYSEGNPAKVENTYTTTETTYENVTDYSRANGEGIAAFGNYNPRPERKLRDRIGQFKPFAPRDRQQEPTHEDNEHQDDDFGTVIPAVVEKSELPVEQETRNYPPVHVPRNKVEFPVLREKPGLPVEQHIENPVIVPTHDEHEVEDKIFAITRAQGKQWKDLHRNMERVLSKMKKSDNNSRKIRELDVQRKDILHDIEQLRNDLGHETDEVISLAADQALDRANLKERLIELDNLMQKRPSDAKGEYAKKDWELNVAKVKNKIEELQNKLGAAAYESNLYYPMPVPGVQAQKKAARRAADEQLREKTVSRETIKDTPQFDSETNENPFEIDFELPEYEQPYESNANIDISNHRVPKLDLGRLAKSQKKDDISDDEIRVIGGNDKSETEITMPKPNELKSDIISDDSMRLSDLDYKPKTKTITREPKEPGVTVSHEPQKDNEHSGLMAALRRAYDKVKMTVPGRKYRVPKSLINVAENSNLISEPITNIRGIPVYLVDLNGNNSPITQNANRAIVVVDVRGLRIPFYLSNGNEGRIAGYWHPLPELYKDGKWLNRAFDTESLDDIPELDDIAYALNNKIGDIRNFCDESLTAEYNAAGYDGFVGGNDVIDHIDPKKVFSLVNSVQYEDTHHRMIFGTYGDIKIAADPRWLRDYMYDLESPEYRKENSGLFYKLRRRFGWNTNRGSRK